MILTWEAEVVQGAFAAAGAGAVGSFGWLAGKLWSLLRHETASMKQGIASNQSSIERHLERDEEVHRELMAGLSEIRGHISGANSK